MRGSKPAKQTSPFDVLDRRKTVENVDHWVEMAISTFSITRSRLNLEENGKSYENEDIDLININFPPADC